MIRRSRSKLKKWGRPHAPAIWQKLRLKLPSLPREGNSFPRTQPEDEKNSLPAADSGDPPVQIEANKIPTSPNGSSAKTELTPEIQDGPGG
jgi:hypothetical protein